MVPVGMIIKFFTYPQAQVTAQSIMDLSKKWKDPYCIIDPNGKLLSVYFEYIEENWACYNGTWP